MKNERAGVKGRRGMRVVMAVMFRAALGSVHLYGPDLRIVRETLVFDQTLFEKCNKGEL